VVQNAVKSFSVAHGSVRDGSCVFNDLFKATAVEKVLKRIQKRCSITLNTTFLRANEDLFCIFFDKQRAQFRVRLRSEEEEEEYDEEAEEEWEFVSRVTELLAAYKPPIERRFCPVTRLIPESEKVPARAILSSKEQVRAKSILERHSQWISCSTSETDGLLLTLLRHPRAADADAHMRRCTAKLHADLGIAEEEAERRLRSDEKFMQYWSSLPIVEKGSADELTVERALRARTRINADAHRVAERVSASWQQVREAMQSVKWYRHMLGSALAPTEGEEVEEDLGELQECLEAIVSAWPDMSAVPKPSKKKHQGGGGGHKGKAKGKHKDKGKGKGKGKG